MDNLVARLVKAIQTYATQAAQVPPKAEDKPADAPPAEAPPAEAPPAEQPPANEAPAEQAPTQEHDDREQDIALLKELVEKLEGGLPEAAATVQGEGTMDAATEKAIGEINAKMALLTDTVSKIANKLLTDDTAKGGKLATDKAENKVNAAADDKPAEGQDVNAAGVIPQRKTMAGMDFAAKYGFAAGESYTLAQVDEVLAKSNLDVRQRMTVKAEMQAKGMLALR
jgi:hypothetical protein